ncbi:SH3 domain-containing protein [Calothrix sp. UHCC 0171]|uniref:SH3 domain-containing protein n=1 Tax=Calothrix sp. UHCC 0171 TaxID=3110245 RepID=UPI002B1FD337|nr:SH3 domain-containing protein [Calothrix sp. UHCC 0171]MEA5572187.1 SH3 domain-containing protein [Calothrix sp. UHCC 0171]
MSKVLKLFMASAVLFASALPASAAQTTAYSHANPGGYGVSKVSNGTLVSQATYLRVCISSGYLNVRGNAGTSYGSIATLRNNVRVRYFDYATGDDGYTWYLVGFGRGRGWVRADYLCSS